MPLLSSTGRALPTPDPSVLTRQRWEAELHALLEHGATLLSARPLQRIVDGTATLSAHLLRLRWPITPPAPYRTRQLELRVWFTETYPWLPPKVAVHRRPAWLMRHCTPTSNVLCLTGHLAPGLQGTWGAIDHDPTELLAELLHRQLPRVIEANASSGEGAPGPRFTPLEPAPAPGAVLEDPGAEGLGTWLLTDAPFLTLDVDSLELNAPVRPDEMRMGHLALAAVRLLPGGSPLHWLGCATSTRGTDGKRTFGIRAAMVDDMQVGSGEGTSHPAPGDLLQLRMAFLPVVGLPGRVEPGSTPDRLWSAAEALTGPDLMAAADSVTRLLGRKGCLQALIVVVPDEIAHRQCGRTPLLLLRSRADRRRKWITSLGTIFDGSPRTLQARHPYQLPAVPGAELSLQEAM